MVINPHTRKPINLRTLERKFKRELADGLQKANAVAAGVVWHHIKKKNLGAAIFWLKTRASWKSAKQVEFFANEDDEPSQVKIEFVKPKGSSDGEGPTP